jgi:hypothetical protein
LPRWATSSFPSAPLAAARPRFAPLGDDFVPLGEIEVGHPIANKEFLVNVFSSLGENRREALKIAAGFRGEDAFEAGVGEEQALETVLPWLSEERCAQLASECLELYCWDRLGVEN